MSPCQGQHGPGTAQEWTFRGNSGLLLCQQTNARAGWQLAVLRGCHPAQLSLAKALSSTSRAGSGFSSSISFCLLYWDLGLFSWFSERVIRIFLSPYLVVLCRLREHDPVHLFLLSQGLNFPFTLHLHWAEQRSNWMVGWWQRKWGKNMILISVINWKYNFKNPWEMNWINLLQFWHFLSNFQLISQIEGGFEMKHHFKWKIIWACLFSKSQIDTNTKNSWNVYILIVFPINSLNLQHVLVTK